MLRMRPSVTALVLVSAALWACGGDDSTQPLAPSSSATTPAPERIHAATDTLTKSNDLVGGLLGTLGLGGKPILFDCQGNGGPYTGSATIGFWGGQVKFGPHTLTVPPLALWQSTKITATTIPGDTIAVQFQPAGTKFLLPANLSLDYGHCQNQPTAPLTIDLLDDLLGTILDLLPSLDPGQGKVSAPIWHFSVYAAAETRSGGRGR